MLVDTETPVIQSGQWHSVKQSCYNLWGASRRAGDSYWNFLLISARHICVDWAWERCGGVDPAHGGQQSTLALRAPTIMTGNKDSALVVAKKSFLHFYSIYSVSSVIKDSFWKKKSFLVFGKADLLPCLDEPHYKHPHQLFRPSWLSRCLILNNFLINVSY